MDIAFYSKAELNPLGDISSPPYSSSLQDRPTSDEQLESCVLPDNF